MPLTPHIVLRMGLSRLHVHPLKGALHHVQYQHPSRWSLDIHYNSDGVGSGDALCIPSFAKICYKHVIDCLSPALAVLSVQTGMLSACVADKFYKLHLEGTGTHCRFLMAASLRRDALTGTRSGGLCCKQYGDLVVLCQLESATVFTLITASTNGHRSRDVCCKLWLTEQ